MHHRNHLQLQGILIAALLGLNWACSGSASLGGGTITAGGSSTTTVANTGGIDGVASSTGGSSAIVTRGVGGTSTVKSSSTVYQPCAGKACGDLCNLCPPNDPNCGETAVIKTCNAAGVCTMGESVCAYGTGGRAGTGGAPNSSTSGPSCAAVECLRAVQCVAYCGGPVLENGCCPCPSGMHDVATLDCSASTGGSTSVGSGTGGSSSVLARLHQSCVDNACSDGLSPTYFYGIAGASGPRFCTCEIPCGADTTCPSGMKCTSIADGPSNVCYSDGAT